MLEKLIEAAKKYLPATPALRREYRAPLLHAIAEAEKPCVGKDSQINLNGKIYGSYQTSCEEFFPESIDALCDIDYCPHCGHKIKFEEA